PMRRVAAGLLIALAACGGPTRARPTAEPMPSTTTPTATTAAPAAPTTTTTARPVTTTARPQPRPTTTRPAIAARPPKVPGPGLAGKIIAVDPGHNGANGSHPAEINRKVDAGGFQKECDTTGTATNAGYTESAYTFDVAIRL